jgi:hypothetical protein
MNFRRFQLSGSTERWIHPPVRRAMFNRNWHHSRQRPGTGSIGIKVRLGHVLADLSQEALRNTFPHVSASDLGLELSWTFR